MKKKECPNCKELKPISDYFKCSSRKDGLQLYCKICKKERFKESKQKSDKKYGKKYLSIPENKEKKHQYVKQYQLDNPEKQKEYTKKHRQSEKCTITRKKYRKKEYDQKYGKDIEWTLKLILRNRLKNALINNFQKGKTLEMLGCSVEEFKLYLEKQFTENMNWDNYGSYWEIDHIKPCDAFNLEILEEQYICFNYKNLQPLEKIKNRKKSNKYE
jgi:hypothetical protein